MNNLDANFKQNLKMGHDQLIIDQVPIVEDISRENFYNDYVNPGKPVIIRSRNTNWKALNWDNDYFRQHADGIKLAIKTGNVSEGKREYMYLSQFAERVERYEEELNTKDNPEKPGYLHDVPFFYLFPELVGDIEPFPAHLFPKYYAKDWFNYIQFFMGTTGSLTPLHFDTLLTNNLFFQVKGQKRFILISEDQKDQCYIKGWRWSNFNPDQPDFEKFPKARGIKASEAIIGPGDILFMPSGMLHQVHGLSMSISFNIDWHTAKTARKGMMSLFAGAPRQNFAYNSLAFLGLGCKVPSKYIFPFYKSYLNYVS